MPASATTTTPSRDIDRPERAVALWLLCCCAMIFAMAVIGAITRLTESGLSIMEWAPVSGALPPLSEAEWQRLFALYRQIPEYQEINRGMSLEEFKTIFWWEYVHRLWGRLIGIVFALPFLWFAIRRRLPRRLLAHLVAIFALGGAQGLLGWFMVASGFSDRVDVSQYRLTAHLVLALAIYAYVFRIAVALLVPAPRASSDPRAGGLRRGTFLFVGLVFATIASGGLVAGLNAGLVYNSFPLMDGDWLPEGYGMMTPWLLNSFENVIAVQFNHRVLALTTALAGLGLWLGARRLDLAPAARTAFALLAAAVVLQAALGIATLLLVVPIWLAALHQAGAILVLTAAIWAHYRLRPLARESMSGGGANV
jgi:cytochrome c oxidase assembly protein subunit 15